MSPGRGARFWAQPRGCVPFKPRPALGKGGGIPLRTLAILALALLAAPLSAAVALPTVPVMAAGFSFTPSVLVVPVGTTIEWYGVALPHTVTTANTIEDALDGRANDPTNSDEDADTFRASLPVGADVQHRFDSPGSFEYFCEFHTLFGMVGTIEVR